MGGNGGEGVFFAWIGFEIEALLGAVGGAPEVFVATVGEGLEGVGGAAGRRGARSGEHEMADDD